jgi:WD40 repeat protein
LLAVATISTSSCGKWEVGSQKCLQNFSGDQGEIRAMTFIPPSSTQAEILVSASDDQTILLSDCNTGKCRKILTGHQAQIWSICYSPELNILFSCAEDETIKFWNLNTGECINTLRIPRPYEGIKIQEISGLTEAGLTTLTSLGAIFS